MRTITEIENLDLTQIPDEELRRLKKDLNVAFFHTRLSEGDLKMRFGEQESRMIGELMKRAEKRGKK